MKILRRFVEQNEWIMVSLKECLNKTEDSGYWPKDSVKNMLKDHQVVFTPIAEYKLYFRIQNLFQGEKIMYIN